MNVNRVFSCALGLCAFGLGVELGWAQSQPKVKVYVNPSVTNAGSLSADQQKEAAAVAGQLAFEIAKYIDEEYPCAQTMTQADVVNLLGHERSRELLGSGDPEALNRIAGAVSADYLLSVTVTAMGPGKYSLNGAMINERSLKTEAHSGTGPNTGDVVDAIDAFADQFTASLASLSKFSNPKCMPRTGWKGTVTVTFTVKGAGNGGSESGTGNLTCQVLGVGSDARCSYQSSDKLTGPGGSIVTTKVAKATSTWVSVSVTGNKLALTIGAIPVLVTRGGLMPTESSTESINGGSFVLPATSDPKHQSGTWTDPNGGSMVKNTVTWDLSKR